MKLPAFPINKESRHGQNGPRRRRGSILMLMIWAVLLMSVTVMGVVLTLFYAFVGRHRAAPTTGHDA